MLHYKKIYDNHFNEIIEKNKRFEIRKADVEYKKDDIIILQEIRRKDKKPTKNKIMIKVQEVYDISDVIPGYVAFNFIILPLIRE